MNRPNFTEYVTWDQLISYVNSLGGPEIQRSEACREHKGLQIVGQHLPVSISEAEFNFMKEYVRNRPIRNAFELATGMGISTLAIQEGLRNKAVGYLTTMDSFQEEFTQSQFQKDGLVGQNSKCQQLAESLVGDSNRVIIEVGSHPKDTAEIMSGYVHQFDFVFLDCPKSDDDFISVITTIKPYLAPQFSMFVHDTHVFTSRADNFLIEQFGKTFTKIHDFPGGVHQVFPLALLEIGVLS